MQALCWAWGYSNKKDRHTILSLRGLIIWVGDAKIEKENQIIKTNLTDCLGTIEGTVVEPRKSNEPSVGGWK